MGDRGDSNAQPLRPQRSALPIELRPPKSALGRTRTSTLDLRRVLLYPVKLRGRKDLNIIPDFFYLVNSFLSSDRNLMF